MSRCYSRMAQLGLVVIAAALVLDCLALALDIMLGRRIVAGQEIAEASLERSSQLSSAANLAVPAAVLLGGAVFIWWFHCAYSRANELQTTNHTPVWAAVSWLVPGINLFRPPQIMIELTKRPLATWLWWALWAVGAVVQVVLRLISPATQQGWVYWQMTALVANLVLLASLAVAFMLVATVSEMARSRSRYWRPDAPPPNQPPKLTTRPLQPGFQPADAQPAQPQPDGTQWAAPQQSTQPAPTSQPASPPQSSPGPTAREMPTVKEMPVRRPGPPNSQPSGPPPPR